MMLSHDKIRVALIGYGLAGSTLHAPMIAATSGLEIAAIVTSNPARAGRAAHDFPGAKVLVSTDELWETPGTYGLVVVATPPRTHALLARKALEQGLAVVIDKPAAITSTELEDLIVAARHSGALLSIFQNRRWDGDFLAVKNVIESNALGQIICLESRWESYQPLIRSTWHDQTTSAEGGGLLYSVGSHLIDQVLLLFGNAKQVYAELQTQRPGGYADDDTFVALGFEGGVYAHLSMSLLGRSANPRFRMLGMKGVYVSNLGAAKEAPARITPYVASNSLVGEPARRRDSGNIEMDSLQMRTKEGDSLTDVPFYSLMRDALSGSGTVPVDPRDAVRTLKVIELARRSADQHQGQAIDSIALTRDD
jgi:scyllo-inositol 2-dehydrogenase (NADP+)